MYAYHEHTHEKDPLEGYCRSCWHVQAGHPETTFDVVAANILRGPLLELQPRLTQYCKPGSHLILSGILAEQVGGRYVWITLQVNKSITMYSETNGINS